MSISSMSISAGRRTDPSDGKSGASPSGPGIEPKGAAAMSPDNHSKIAHRAYQLANARGFAPGRELEDWLQAEREVEAGAPRNTPPDNPFDVVKTRSNE
jgi:Protein of unknown function (DUF2934).